MSRSRKKSPGRAVILIVVLIFVCILLYGTVNARIVRVMNVVENVRNLDSRLEGYRILYVSDLKISSNAEARQSARMLEKLCRMDPDVLIIGGDVTGKNTVQSLRTLFSKDEVSKVSDELTQARDNFFLKLTSINVPCYIVPGDEDQVMSLETQRLTKVTMLSDSWVKLNVSGASLVIAGTADYKMGVSVNKNTYPDQNADFYLFVAHDPRYLREISLLKRWDGRPLADMALSAHTLGGQIRIGGWQLLYGRVIESYESSRALDVNTLISEGIGTEYLPIRIGTKPTAYLITLQRAR